MTSEEMHTFLSEPMNAIIGTNRRAGGPQLTPVWFLWDGESFFFTTTKDRVKYSNLKRDPYISLIVDDPQTRQYIVAYGRAEIIEQNAAQAIRQIFEKYVPEDQLGRWTPMADAPGRVAVVLRPEKVLTS